MTQIIIRKTTVDSLVHNSVQIKFKTKYVCWPHSWQHLNSYGNKNNTIPHSVWKLNKLQKVLYYNKFILRQIFTKHYAHNVT